MTGSFGAPARPGRALARAAALACMVGTALAPQGAHATGTLDCSIDDTSVAFDAQTAFSHGMGGSFNNFRAVLELKPPRAGKDAAKDDAPAFGKMELDGEALVHHWFHGNEVRLHLYHERPDPAAGAAELVIETRARGSEAESFAGRYVLTVTTVDADGKARTRTLKGRATCSAG